MRDGHWIDAALLTLLLSTVSMSAAAQDLPSADWSFRGGFQLGFRAVDVDGREEKYREDIDLEDGPRLFHLNFDLTPPQEVRQYFDHLEMQISNAGGDPFETARIELKRYGRYSVKWEQRKSSYFYEDIILPPELASPELLNGGDSHTFDVDRVRDTASLRLWIGDSGRFDLGFDRFTKRGRSTTTYNVQRDEFEVERPIDESLSEYHAGLSYDWEHVTVILREQLREFDNSVEAFLPGASAGSVEDDPTVLDFFFLDQPYDLTSRSHSAAVVARPSERLLLHVQATQEDLDLDLAISEASQGVDFRGVPFSVDETGAGAVSRDLSLIGLSMSYRLSSRLALVLDTEKKSLDQEGRLAFSGAPSSTAYTIDTTSSEAALQMDITSKVSLSAGVRNENRDVGVGGGAETANETTDQTGYYALLGWHPDRYLSVSAKLDSSSFDHPFTASSPSDREGLRLRARYARPMGLSLSGTYRRDSIENADSGWQADSEHLSLRAGYRFALLSLSMGYSVIEADRGLDQTVVTLPGFLGGLELVYPIAYSSDAEIIDARVSWAVNPHLKLGGDARRYENDGTFPLRREHLKVFSEVGFGDGYVLHLGMRRIDYDEVADDFDDYRADIVEVSLGYRWQ